LHICPNSILCKTIRFVLLSMKRENPRFFILVCQLPFCLSDLTNDNPMLHVRDQKIEQLKHKVGSITEHLLLSLLPLHFSFLFTHSSSLSPSLPYDNFFLFSKPIFNFSFTNPNSLSHMVLISNFISQTNKIYTIRFSF
jgi:hypothetical protein